MRVVFGVLVALVVSACGSDGSVLRVDLRTDYVPEIEVGEVDVLSGPTAMDAVLVHEVGADDYVRGVWLGAYEGLRLITRNCEEDSCSSGSCDTGSDQEKFGPCGG